MTRLGAIENPTRHGDGKAGFGRGQENTVLQFERSDISLFRNLATLAQKAGVPQDNIVKLAFKELADNALDAGAHVTFEYADELTWVKDDGQGIPGTDDEIASLFSIGRPLRSSKLLRLPTRGALGNGLRVVAGLVLCTGGRLAVRTSGRELDLEPLDNGDTRVRSVKPWDGTGTEVGVRFGEPEDGMLDWAQVAADYAGCESFKGASSPYWYDSDSFYELCAASPTHLSARSLIERLDGCSGRKAGAIAAPVLGRYARDLTRSEADSILVAARTQARPVTPKRLGTIGERPDFDGYGKATGTITIEGRREGRCAAELPVVIEAWARSTDDASSGRILVNKTVAAASVAVSNFGKHVYLSGCGYSGEVIPSGGHDWQIVVNIQTPYVAVTSDGKAPDLGPFYALLHEAIRTAVGRAKRAVGVVRADDPKHRITFKDSVLDHLDEAVDLASGEGQYRFNQRNLYYQIRPFVLREVGELTYGTFTNIVTDVENDTGPIAGMYRNERGVLIHPHSGDVIALGTLSVEKYARPLWTFNKVLYVEKEGFFQTLRTDGWPERHDCALMTSQGFASRAARDLIDAIGESEEPIQIFCIHDADAFGTKIYESLQDATRARPGRKVEIINLGLERDEAEAMGLECEDLPPLKKEKPTASYVSSKDHVWYQTHRYELNAMTAPQLIAWLDGKMRARAGSKIVPPSDVIESELRAAVYTRIADREKERILREADIGALVRKRVADLEAEISRASVGIDADVSGALDDEPELLWSDAVSRIAARVVGDKP